MASSTAQMFLQRGTVLGAVVVLAAASIFLPTSSRIVRARDCCNSRAARVRDRYESYGGGGGAGGLGGSGWWRFRGLCHPSFLQSI
jgi:hypothetical protein